MRVLCHSFNQIFHFIASKMASTIAQAASRRQLWLLATERAQLVKRYNERRVVGYSAEQMFDIVNDVEKYPLFVPWCKQAIAHKKTGSRAAEYELFIGFPPLKEHYTSRVTTLYPTVIHAVCTEGRLFDMFDTTWRFGPNPGGPLLNKHSCTIFFTLEFQFKSQMYASLSGLVFDRLVSKMVCAFLSRAAQIHGPPLEQPIATTGASPLRLDECDKLSEPI